MFYVFSILGVNKGENRVLRTEKKRIPGSDPWMGLWGCVGRGVYRGIADMGGMISAALDLSERKAMIPLSQNFSFCLPSALDHGGNGNEGW